MPRIELPLVNYTALPPPLPKSAVTWGASSKDAIIQLLNEGRSVEEICNTTGNRRTFVKTVAYRFNHPEEFIVSQPVRSVESSRRLNHRSDIVCKGCGTTFSVPNCQRDAIKFCTRECRRTYWDARKVKVQAVPKERVRKKTHTIVCKNCGKQATVLKPTNAFCDQHCYFQFKRNSKKAPTYTHVCRHCNNEFGSWVKNRVYCSAKCRLEHTWKPAFEGQLSRDQKPICRNCHQPFKVGNNQNIYCSWACFKAYPHKTTKRKVIRSREMACVVCAKTFRVFPSHDGRKTCSMACYNKIRRSRHAPPLQAPQASP
ncbi:hypothetical protein NTE_01771 [Candidatus Nitrososphaera evergladensis SR1]|uniref:Uncharacterized protein n=1 Tax=Candidatus Nitrososphaera evergladensis SR1 TaxID=1459636 RepID=A0A075MSS6_9ARCH|nr:hypothetical protein NTE_01771 [Candidatus Nitrososphaera evergladensis SR1]